MCVILELFCLMIDLCTFCVEQASPQKITMLKSCVKELPKANYATLKLLSDHLRK